MKNILLVEDDINLAYIITEELSVEGYKVNNITQGESVMTSLCSMHPEIVLLDINLNGNMTGFDVADLIRNSFASLPILFITSRTSCVDIEKKFSYSYSDYLKKPFGLRELLLRINRLVSFSDVKKKSKYILSKNTFFSPVESTLCVFSETMHLQHYECEVLSVLCAQKESIVSKNEILDMVWNDLKLKQKESSLYNIISLLRKKLSKDDAISIISYPKMGWKLSENN